MKTNFIVPEEIYQAIYNIVEEEKNEYDTEVIFCYEDDNWIINGKAEYEVKFVDDSFSHEFGNEYAYHYEAGDIYDINVDRCSYFENAGHYNEIEHEVHFDSKKFFSVNNI